MTNADPTVIGTVNELAERRFRLEVRKAAENQRFKDEEAALRSTHQARLAGIQTQIDELDGEIWQTVEASRGSLIKKGKKSFVTMAAKFQLRDLAGKTKVADKKGVLDVARKLGVVRKIARVKIVWDLDTKKFLDWLDRHGELRPKFEEFLDEPAGGESLTIQPNANYTVHHDTRRISPPSVTIKKS